MSEEVKIGRMDALEQRMKRVEFILYVLVITFIPEITSLLF